MAYSSSFSERRPFSRGMMPRASALKLITFVIIRLIGWATVSSGVTLVSMLAPDYDGDGPEVRGSAPLALVRVDDLLLTADDRHAMEVETGVYQWPEFVQHRDHQGVGCDLRASSVHVLLRVVMGRSHHLFLTSWCVGAGDDHVLERLVNPVGFEEVLVSLLFRHDRSE